MNFKKLLATGIVVVSVITQSIPAFAASVKDVFDAKYYASQYEDLQKAFGDNEKALFNHYLKYGLKESRNASPVLNIAAYRDAYADLDEAFGDNWDAYVNHFFEFGAAEHRDEGVLFNPIDYATLYSDINAAFGDDLSAVTKHYMENGIKENRTAGTAAGYASLAEKRAAKKAAELAASNPANDIREVRTDYASGMYEIARYNTNDQLIELLVYNPGGTLAGSTVYTYGNGHRTGITNYNSTGKATEAYGWTYDSNGSVIACFWSNLDVDPTDPLSCAFGYTKYTEAIEVLADGSLKELQVCGDEWDNARILNIRYENGMTILAEYEAGEFYDYASFEGNYLDSFMNLDLTF